MSSTLLRLGLWTVVLILVIYVLSSYENAPLADMIPSAMLQQSWMVAALIIVAGVVVRMFEKTKSVVTKNRCRVCRTPIPSGAIYCRAHLRSVLEREDERSHMTRTR